jgi:TonB-linked SusC/RagA family outer membrane protein
MKIASFGRILVAALFVTTALAAPDVAEARQTGTLTGQVVEDGTNRPLGGVEVTVVGTRLSTVTNDAGRYVLTSVPAGERSVRVQLIGYGSTTRSVSVIAGESTVANFTLHATAIGLEQVVVTGTIGATQRAKLPFVVDQVRTADIPVPSVSAVAALQGKVAGATIVSPTGRPGSSPTVLLRGPTSINASGRSQEPLYIVDGVILGAGMVDFDALDIESIEVVKGAAGASLYGSRAQAGVIQVRTRRGSAMPTDQVRYTVRSELGTSALPRTPDALFGQTHWYLVRNGKFVVGATECDIMECPGSPQPAGQRAGLPGYPTTPNTWNSFAIEPFPGPTYNQVDRFFRDGAFQQHYVSAEGRAGNTNFHASFSNLTDEGIMRGQDGFDRFNFRLNLDQQLRPTTQISASAFYSRNEQNNFTESQGNNMFALTRMPAGVNLFSCQDDWRRECLNDPKNLFIQTDVFSRESPNPLYSLLNTSSIQQRGRFLGSANVRYNPVEWLNFDATASYDRFERNDKGITPKGFRSGFAGTVTDGGLSRFVRLQEGLNASFTATATRQLGQNITNRTQVRYLAEHDELRDVSTSGSRFAVADVHEFGNIEQTTLSAGSFSRTVRADGFFGITNFDIHDRYIVDVLVRNDGSSLFGADERRHWYYRAAAAWRLTEEPWFSIPGLNEFKLRYSYGTAGGRPRFEAQYETYSVSGGVVSPVQLGNRLLKPEFTREHEAGFEAALFDNRLLASLTYADSETRDQILLVPLPAFRGFGSQWRNAGTLASNTWEASLDARLVSTRNLSWSARLLYDRTRQTITELNVPAYTTGVAGQGMGDVFYVRPGEGLGTFYGRRIAQSCNDLPITQQPFCNQYAVNDDGWLVWIGANGSFENPQWGSSGTVDGVTRLWGAPFAGECDDHITGERTNFCAVGKGLPDYKIGLSSNLTWRGLTVYGLLDSWQGFNVHNQPLIWTIFKQLGGILDQTGKPEHLQKPIGYYDAIYAINILSPTSFTVEDGSFVKLRELSVRYRFGADQLSRLPALSNFSGLTFSLIGRNLYTWTNYRGYDPEVGRDGGSVGSAALARVEGHQYPPFRTWTLGVELNF